MKNLLNLALLLLFLVACETSKQDSTSENETNKGTSIYDSLLALETGADNYGMRKYIMALLKAGPNRDQDSLEVVRLQRAHLDNIARMAEEGTLVMAGPFFDDWEVKGIYIFAVETIEEAEELTKTDPAVQAGRLRMELHPWYGSAILMKMSKMHKKVSKEPI